MTVMSLPETFADSGREYWRGVLLSGGFTAIPRWTAEPVPGVAQHDLPSRQTGGEGDVAGRRHGVTARGHEHP